LPSISVAVAPLRNLTGDPDRQYLVEAFTDDLVTDLLRHGRALSLKPLEEERAALGNGTRTSERGFDYVVTGARRAALLDCCGSTCGLRTPRHPSTLVARPPMFTVNP
jgi:TolB-like protein